MMFGRFALTFALSCLVIFHAKADMRGHGGPVRAIAISADGKTAVTGSFDTTVIIWDLERDTAKQVLRLHEGAISGVSFLNPHTVISSGDDGRLVLWDILKGEPIRTVVERGSPVIGLSNSGAATIHVDRTVRGPGDTITTLSDDPISITSAAGLPLVATRNSRLVWLLDKRTITLPSNANTLASTPDGEIIAGGADGKVYILKADGSTRLTADVQEMPITSLAVSVDGALIAAAGLRGAVTILNRATGATVSALVGPGLPVWSLAFHPDGKTILTGGADRVVRKWTVATGQPLSPANAPKPDFPASVMNERGAQVFKACEACHTVTPDGGNRAGPTLHGVFGRKIGTAKDYVYSSDFSKHGIVWNAETIAQLFREGPAKVTPGTKMPEQRITDAEDLQALVEWLERVTR
jgi:cytochrome c